MNRPSCACRGSIEWLLHTEYSKMEVLTLRQSGDDWKLLLPDELRRRLDVSTQFVPGNVEESMPRKLSSRKDKLSITIRV